MAREQAQTSIEHTAAASRLHEMRVLAKTEGIKAHCTDENYTKGILLTPGAEKNDMQWHRA